MKPLSLNNQVIRLQLFDFGIKSEENPDYFLNVLFTDKCNVQQSGCINNHDMCLMLVSSLINIQKQEKINNFHVRVKTGNIGTYVYWRSS